MSSDPKPVGAEEYPEDYFLERVGGAEFYRRYGPKILKPALQYALRRAELRSGMTALDLGCGRGELLYHLAQGGARAVGADFAPAALGIARRTTGAPVVRCDAKQLPFKDAIFDRIFFLGVLDHLHDWELERCFSQMARLLKPDGLVLADTCANTDYHKNITYGLRRRLATALGLKEPTPPRSDEDESLHVNEHNGRGLRDFFARIGWDAEIEAKPNEKYLVPELYGNELPVGFPMKELPAWKRIAHACTFRGPWKRHLARSWFCILKPRGRKELS